MSTLRGRTIPITNEEAKPDMDESATHPTIVVGEYSDEGGTFGSGVASIVKNGASGVFKLVDNGASEVTSVVDNGASEVYLIHRRLVRGMP